MKINSIHIASFGKFKDFTFNFTDGFNLVYGDNEDGKTTIMSFIKMMFYGSHTKSQDLSKNLRKKYTPWDSSFMAGSIDFTHKGTSYRLEREFKGSSTDKISLINLDLGTKTTLSGKTEPGVEFFGLSIGAFEKSLFVGSLGSPEKDELADGEINSRLSNIITTGDEDISFEIVKKRILKAKEALMSKSGKKGAYDIALSLEAELENKILKAKQTELSAKDIELKITEKEKVLANLNSEANNLFDLLKNAEKIKKRALLERYITVLQKKEEIEKKLTLTDGQTITPEYVDSLKALIDQNRELNSKINTHSLKVNGLIEEINRLKTSVEDDADSLLLKQKNEIDDKLLVLTDSLLQDKLALEQLKLKNQSSKTKRNINIPLIIIGIIVMALGAVAYTSSSIITLVCVAVGLIISFLGFVLKNKKGNNLNTEKIINLTKNINASEQELSSLKEKAESLNKTINQQLIEKGGKKILLDDKKQELLSSKEELLALKEDLATKATSLLSLCNKFKATEDVALAPSIVSIINDLFSQLKEAEIHINIAAEPVGNIPLSEAISRFSALNENKDLNQTTPEQLNLARDMWKQKNDEIGRIKGEIATYKTELKALTANESTVPVLERKLIALRENLCSQKAFCDKADIAIASLEEAFIDLRQNYSSALEEKTSHIFSLITDGLYKSVNISKNFDINVTAKDSFGLKDWQYLSSGTTDQAYLSLRLGLATLIEDENEPLPLFLDDVLAQYDDKRALTAIKFLKDYAKDRQIVFFTCHSYFSKLGENLGITTRDFKE